MDLLIKHAKIIDGTGNPFYFGDIGIANGRIQAIGHLSPAPGTRVIDAAGLATCPGFIDGHSHSDFALLQNNRAESSLRQGVTTEVIGNCGLGYVPVTELNHDTAVAMSRTYQPDIPVTWRSFAQYREALESRRLGINVVVLLPHGTLRQAVLGDVNRPATDGEIERMKTMLQQAMDEGAAGLSTGLEYRSSVATDERELAALLKVVAASGKVHTTHIRNRDKCFREAVEEVLKATEVSGPRLVLSHLTAKPGSRPDDWQWIMDTIERKRAQGMDITCDMIPYRVGPGMLYNILPEWMFEGGTDALLARLRDPNDRRRLQTQCNRYWLLFERQEWDKLTLTGSREHPELTGKTFREISLAMKKPPLECIFDILSDAGQGVTFVTINGLLFSEEHVVEILTHPLYGIASDGWTSEENGVTSAFANHPNCFGWVPRVLSHYVRERKIMRLEEAVRKMTSLPAQRFKLAERGMIRENHIADLAIFDDATIVEEASYQEPRKYCTQMKYVLMAGRIVVENGITKELLSGNVLAA